MRRASYVAGTFYPGDQTALRQELTKLIRFKGDPVSAFGIIAPHAGYVYSGPIAGLVYGRVEVPETVILLAPNHTGYGKRASLWESGEWDTPLGAVRVDSEVTRALCRQWSGFENAPEAHIQEHSGEVHLPFLMTRNPQVNIAPVVLAMRDPEAIDQAAQAIADVVREAENQGKKIMVVASTDMNHFDDDATTRKKDALARERVLAMDPDGLLEVVAREDISMCGAVPTAIMMKAAMLSGRGEEHVEEVGYDTSAATSGDFSRVVGYFGAIVR